MKNNRKTTTSNGITDEKLKPLLPTLRQKKRFIKAKIHCHEKLTFKEISENMIDELIQFIGAIEFGKGGIWILRDKFDYENQTVVLKVNLKTKDKLLGALALINYLGKGKCRIETLRVSGTLKGLEKN